MNRVRKVKTVETSHVFLFILILTLNSALCFADDVYTFVIQKQQAKEKNRWSLEDWLDTRDRMRIQDLWFAVHSPSPYEYKVGGSYQLGQSGSPRNFNTSEAYFAAYATIVGLEVRYESGMDQRWFGLFNFRVFGYHDQSTNITLQAGLRNSSSSDYSFNNALAGAELTFYLRRYFGLEGMYRHYFSSTPNSTGVTSSGDRFQAGAFIDFSALRFYGDYYSDTETWISQSGVALGMRVYF